MTRYSQHTIEKYLDQYFPEGTGNFLEIGCWNGELISQTFYLESERGWTGLCVDPFPKQFEKRLCQLCSKAVSKDGGPRIFIKVSIDRRYRGDVSYFSGFKDKIAEHWPLISEHCDYEEIVVDTITFSQLYEQFSLPRHIEFLSIDTEGAEVEIFESIDFDKYTFGLIVFEHNANEEIKQKIGGILTSHGYILLDSLRCDDIYVALRMLK
jgi:FkbM family methyltransferase